MVAKELRMIMAEHGLRTVDEMVGRIDLLRIDAASDHWKAKALDLQKILEPIVEPEDCLGVYRQHEQDHGLVLALDNELIALAQPALTEGKRVRESLPIRNTNRVVGGMLSNAIIKAVGPDMLPDDTVHFKFTGSAGQSFGAWLAKGVTLEVEGDANDYVGKGLSGGRLVIYPPKNSPFNPEEEVLIGNVVLYGATGGECYFRGIAAERFCVRNSGATAVVEGVGDHGCEYMTGGRVIVLGPTGRNFAAGMSGGIAYVWDPNVQFAPKCNMELVELETLTDRDEIDEIKKLIDQHAIYTGSTVAKQILDNWATSVREFAKVMPTDYKRILESMSEQAELASAEV